MLEEIVFPQPLTVIARDDNPCMIEDATMFQIIEQET